MEMHFGDRFTININLLVWHFIPMKSVYLNVLTGKFLCFTLTIFNHHERSEKD